MKQVGRLKIFGTVKLTTQKSFLHFQVDLGLGLGLLAIGTNKEDSVIYTSNSRSSVTLSLDLRSKCSITVIFIATFQFLEMQCAGSINEEQYTALQMSKVNYELDRVVISSIILSLKGCNNITVPYNLIELNG